MSLYALYRSRQWLGGVPALLAAAAFLLALRSEPLKIQPVYDESAVELALVQPEPEAPPAPAQPPAPQVQPPSPVVEEHEAVLPPVLKPVVPPPPKPTPPLKPTVAKVAAAKPAPRHPSVASPLPTAAAPAVSKAEPAAAPPPAPPAPKVDSGALEGGYLQGLRSDMERFKQYPTGRQASLERPSGNVVVWMLVDRAGNVLDCGLETPAGSMLLNRAAETSLKRIKQVKPFPEQAFGGRQQQRFTATFNYSVQ